MKLGRTLYSWLVVALIGFGVVGAIETSYLPQANDQYANPVADGLVFASLYAGMFLFILGLGVVAGYGWRWMKDKGMYPVSRWEIIRQASLAALGVVAIFALRGYHVFSWWDAILLVVALVLVEFSFRVKRTEI
jgi:hypothetical protein